MAAEPDQNASAQTTSGDPSRRSFLVKLSLGVAALAFWSGSAAILSLLTLIGLLPAYGPRDDNY